MSEIKLTNDVEINLDSLKIGLDENNLLAQKQNTTGSFTYKAVDPCIVYLGTSGRGAQLNGVGITHSSTSANVSTYGFLFLKTGDTIYFPGYESWNQTAKVFGVK